MSNWELIVPHVTKWEGGLGADPNDNAIKKYPAANNSGILMKTGKLQCNVKSSSRKL